MSDFAAWFQEPDKIQLGSIMPALSDLRPMRHSFLKLLPGVIAFLLLALCFVITSLWLQQPSCPPLVWIPRLEHGDIHLGVVGGMGIGLLICFVLVIFGSKGWFGYKERVKHAFSNWVLVFSFLGALVGYFIVLVIASNVKPATAQSGFWPSLLVHIEENPGGLFALMTGLPTLYGLALAVEQLWEIRRAIRSFSELIDRVSVLAKGATSQNPLRIVAYTPSIGYLAQPPDEWNRFMEAIEHKSDGKPIAQIVCLKRDELDDWHKLFIGRTTLRGEIKPDLPESAATTSQSAAVISQPPASPNQPTRPKDATDAGEYLVTRLQKDTNNRDCDNVCRLPFNCLPGYYLFFTKRRAIIVVPLFLPLLLPAKLQSHNAKLPPVQMIGFETTDRAYIKDFEVMFQRYFELNGKV